MSNNILEHSLDAGDVVVCVKDMDKKVLSQNDYCRKLCGDQLGKKCETGCMALYASDDSQQWKDWGSRVYKNSFLHGKSFDVTLLCSTDNIITFLQPLKEKYDMALD